MSKYIVIEREDIESCLTEKAQKEFESIMSCINLYRVCHAIEDLKDYETLKEENKYLTDTLKYERDEKDKVINLYKISCDSEKKLKEENEKLKEERNYYQEKAKKESKWNDDNREAYEKLQQQKDKLVSMLEDMCYHCDDMDMVGLVEKYLEWSYKVKQLLQEIK